MDFLLQGVAVDCRADGRRRLDFRPLALETDLYPHANGSARIALGNTHVIVSVTAQLDSPTKANPNAGAITPNITTATNLKFEKRYESTEAAIAYIESALTAIYSQTCMPDALASLCIVPAAQCWHLRVHAHVLCCDGCPIDAISVAIRAALHATRIPKLSASQGLTQKGQHDLDIQESLDEFVTLRAEEAPVFASLAIIDGFLVADCTTDELDLAGSTISVAINPKDCICAIRFGGLFGAHVGLFSDVMQSAYFLGRGLLHVSEESIVEAQANSAARGFPHRDGSAMSFVRGAVPFSLMGASY